MHIPNHALDPATCIVTGTAAAAAVGYSIHRLRTGASEQTKSLIGITTACIFAGQMLNFPISGGTSGHLMGGVLAGILLGPWAGILSMTTVVLIQCLLFHDGGLDALGANVLNMAVVGAGAGYFIYASVSRCLAGWRGQLLGATFAAWASVLLAALLCSVELAAGGAVQLVPTLSAMLPAHAMIGVGEAMITATALACILAVRPSLIYGGIEVCSPATQPDKSLAPALLIAVLLTAVLVPFASALPDGLEVALAQIAPPTSASTATNWSPLADYQIAGHEFAMAGSFAGVIGMASAYLVGQMMSRYRPRRMTSCPPSSR